MGSYIPKCIANFSYTYGNTTERIQTEIDRLQ